MSGDLALPAIKSYPTKKFKTPKKVVRSACFSDTRKTQKTPEKKLNDAASATSSTEMSMTDSIKAIKFQAGLK